MSYQHGKRRALLSALALFAFLPVRLAAETPAPNHYVVKDARDIEPNAVRFAAAQISGDHQAIALLGGTKATWPTIKGGIEDAEARGCRVTGIIVGPSSAAPALEVYAKGIYVTNDINPNTISRADLAKLICDVQREYF